MTRTMAAPWRGHGGFMHSSLISAVSSMPQLQVAALLVAVGLGAAPAAAQSLSPARDPSGVAVPSQPKAPDAIEPLPTFGSIFRDLGRDFRHLPSRQNAVILGVGGAL